jgi:hypothetical protein
MSRDVCGALTETLKERREWDEEPCLYVMYRQGGDVRLSRLIPEGAWPSGPPAQTLAALADQAARTLSALIVAVPDLAGFAFRSEIWAIREPGSDLGRLREMAAGPRPSVHPDRIEQRFIWAVTLDGTHYTAMQDRGDRAILAHKVDVHDGDIPRALEQMVKAVTAGMQ